MLFILTYGPQRNHMQGTGKERMDDDRRPYAPPNDRRNHGYQGSKPTVGGFQPDSYPLCRARAYKEVLSKVESNAAKDERSRTTGRVFTMSGAETSAVDGLNQGNCMVTGIPHLVLLIRDRTLLGRIHPNECAGSGVDDVPQCRVVVNVRTFIGNLICLS
ncbi:hypothetical protein Lal_00039972 [Lupinus albus]|nr:hypothetical protein Lal_00039972 [Lupinus albus]